MASAALAIALGAALGALLRWVLGLSLNSVFTDIPLGTLAANLIGGYLIGISLPFFADLPGLAPEWRLFVVTGFLGGLTTFSTFSAEVARLIQEQRLVWATAAVGAHVLGSLLMTFAGIGTVALLRRIA